LQVSRTESDPPLRHRTRNGPKRAAELCAGGSIYWVIAGTLLVRQRVVDVVPDVRPDGARCIALVFDPELVRVAARPVKAFQGWRYLTPEDAPADLAGGSADADLPDEMRRALAALALL
jgi:hypothetical protein